MRSLHLVAASAAAALGLHSPALAQDEIQPYDLEFGRVVQPLILPACGDTHLNPATMVHLRLARPSSTKSLVYSNPDREGPEAALSQGSGGKILGYTRLRVLYRSCGGDQRDYISEKRNALKRFFLGKHAQKLLTIDARITPLDVKTTRTLASIKRDSTKHGEEWATEVENDGILLPYFRLDRSTVVSIEAKLHSTREYDSSIGADTLDIVQRAATLINPTTALITAENKDRFNKAANFVDEAVSGLLKVSIDEQVRLSVPLNPDSAAQVLAVMTLKVPEANDAYRATLPERMVGQWIIFAEPTRVSMLDDAVNGGDVSRKTTTAAAILNYLVDDKKTLREALSGVTALVTARDALIASDGAAVQDKARSLCRVVATEALSLGLTPVDAGAAAWAYLADLALPTARMSGNAGAESGCSDVEHYPKG